MKKFLYLFLFPIAAVCVVLTAFFFAGQDTASVPVETAVLSEDTGAPEQEEAAPVSMENRGEFEALHEFQSAVDETQQEEEKEIERHAPEQLSIPAIGVEGPVEEVGILDNGQMGVPDSAEGIGWFAPGVKPGEQGNAVLAGHVDSRTGPAVFFDLHQLETGDEVEVTDETGEKLTFEVVKKAAYPRNDAPMEEIFGSTDSRNLNLITCTGTFDREQGTHDERLVVYTQLVEEEPENLDPEIPTPDTPENIRVSGKTFSWHAVQDEDIVGYRIYEETEAGEFEQIASAASYERKSYSSDTVGERRHYVTAVNAGGVESAPSEKK